MIEFYAYDPETLAQMHADADAVADAVQEAVQEALQMHKRLGNPVASWENGQVVWVQPYEIPGPNGGATQ